MKWAGGPNTGQVGSDTAVAQLSLHPPKVLPACNRGLQVHMQSLSEAPLLPKSPRPAQSPTPKTHEPQAQKKPPLWYPVNHRLLAIDYYHQIMTKPSAGASTTHLKLGAGGVEEGNARLPSNRACQHGLTSTCQVQQVAQHQQRSPKLLKAVPTTDSSSSTLPVLAPKRA